VGGFVDHARQLASGVDGPKRSGKGSRFHPTSPGLLIEGVHLVIIEQVKGSELLSLKCQGQKEFGTAFPILAGLRAKKRWDKRTLIFEPEPTGVLYIAMQFPEAEWVGDASKHLELVRARNEERERLRADKASGIFEDDGAYEYLRPPRDHQRDSFIRARSLEAYGHFHEMGCGKSKIIIDTAAFNFKAGRITNLAIIAPNGVHQEWVTKMLPEDIPEWLPYRAHCVSPKKTQKEAKAIQEVMEFNEGLRVLTFHVEGFVSKTQKDRLKRFLKSGPTLMVLDESSDIKNPDAKRTKTLDRMGRRAVMRRICDGTPVTEGIHELFSQFRFLCPTIIGHTQNSTFQARYCRKGGWKGEQITGYQNVEELLALIDPYCDRVLKADVIKDLPEKTYHRMPFELSPDQRKIIGQLREKIAAEWKNKKLDPKMAMTRLLRVQQVASGWWPDEEDGELIPLAKKNPRAIALDSILNHTRGKAIIWSRFVSDLDYLQERYGASAVRYHGKISKDQRVINVKNWKESETANYLLAHPQSGIARGFTLVEAQTTVYYANHLSLRKRLQSEDRNHRDGQRSAVNVWDLMGTGAWSIDARIIAGYRAKKEISDIVTGDPAGFLTWLPEDG